MRRLALLAVLLSAPAVAAQNSFSSQLTAMSELARTTMFNQYMNTAGKTCGGVQRACQIIGQYRQHANHSPYVVIFIII